MTVFKTFWNIVKRNIGTIFLYTAILLLFGVGNSTTNDNTVDFVNSKPDVYIINKDKENKITSNFVDYITDNSNIIKLDSDEEKIDDAIFYRDVNYVIYIPENYGVDVLKGENPQLDIKSSGDYMASLTEMILNKYISVQNNYAKIAESDDELIKLINENISKTVDVEVLSKVDLSKTSRIATYYNFASYSIMALIIFIICLVLSSFKEKTVNKRTIISSMNYKKHNRLILLGSFCYALVVWVLCSLFSIFIIGEEMLTLRGLIYTLNLFVFTFCSLTIALFISSLVKNKNAINGIVNVVALGSAFLCGAFVPTEWLPDFVLKAAHILPSYWYINANDLLKSIEVINLENLSPILCNYVVLIIFSLGFLVLNNLVTKIKLKTD